MKHNTQEEISTPLKVVIFLTLLLPIWVLFFEPSIGPLKFKTALFALFEEEKETPKTPELIWYDAQLKVTYYDNTIDTVSVIVYEDLKNIQLKEGDLTYWTQGVESYIFIKKTIASYVKKFEILQSNLKKR